MKTNQQMTAFIGTYGETDEDSIYACSFDTQTGELSIIDAIKGLKNPTFLDVDDKKSKLYVMSSEKDGTDQEMGVVTAFEIDTKTMQLTMLNKEKSVSPTCHITLDQSRNCVIVSSYRGGMIGVLPVLENGLLGQLSDVHQHEGKSIHPNQEKAHTHSVFMDAYNLYAVACDLGIDQILIYKLDLEHVRLIPHGITKVAPGAGPRHFSFHPKLPFGYVINELNSTFTAFSYKENSGELTEIQTLSTLPVNYNGKNACADIHISSDGKFLYGSNRGHDSIVVCSIHDSNGHLEVIDFTSTSGKHPRNFALSPDNRFLLAANRDSNNIVTFERNSLTGKLTQTEKQLNVSKPVCIKFMPLNS